MQCESCGESRIVAEADEIEYEGKVYNDSCSGITRRRLKRQFGASDVEHLAKMMYSAFHGESENLEDWVDYEPLKGDDVVGEFRRMAMLVSDYFADGHIGEVYYK